MPQSWDVGQIFSLPLRRNSCWGFIRTPEKSNGFGRVQTRELGKSVSYVWNLQDCEDWCNGTFMLLVITETETSFIVHIVIVSSNVLTEYFNKSVTDIKRRWRLLIIFRIVRGSNAEATVLAEILLDFPQAYSDSGLSPHTATRFVPRLFHVLVLQVGAKLFDLFDSRLTPLSRALEKLRNSQLVKKSPSFYGTQRFIS